MTPASVPPDTTIAPAAAVVSTYTSAYQSTSDGAFAGEQAEFGVMEARTE